MSIEKTGRPRRVLDLDLDQDPLRRVHRRLGELVGVHLAEALKRLTWIPLASSRRTRSASKVSASRSSAEGDRERRGADDVDELLVGAAKARVGGRGEQVDRHDDVLAALVAVSITFTGRRSCAVFDRQVVAVRRNGGENRLDVVQRGGVGLDQPVLDHERAGAAP